MTIPTGTCPFGFSSEPPPTGPGADLYAGQTPTAPEAAGPADAPVADWVDPLQMMADPYPTYERLRRESPVAWVPVLNKYLVTTYDLCHQIEMDQEIFSADVSGSAMNRALGGKPMLRKDDPEHATDRATVNPVLRPKNLKQTWAPVFERNARKYLEVLADKGPESADLNHDYAAPVASQNLIDLLGLKDVEVEQLRKWSHDFIAGTGNVLNDPDIWSRCDSSQAELDALLHDLIPYYASRPDASMTSALANSGLPYADVAANIKLTISGGMNEPQHMITNIVWGLSNEGPGARAALTEGLMWPEIFDEAVRWLSPIGMYPRETTRETILGGIRLPAGAGIGVVVGSANRDIAVFGDDADAFNPYRAKQAHLGFGSGVHLCAGHWAARISIGQIAVPLAYERFPGLRIDERRTPAWDGWVFRGLTSLPVTWN